ncbi:MAG: hypothetical protein QOJ50_1279 [Cryptosporangiaceae bacterium]|nr:hypothetical protein [Cryptosporangiaceae bacterium]
MRNGDDDRTTTPRFWQRKQLIAGTAGLAIVFGGSVALTRYFVTDEASKGSQGDSGSAAVTSPGGTPAAATPSAGPAATAAARPQAAAAKPSPRPTSRADRIAAARAAVKKAGPTVHHAVPQTRTDEPLTVRTYGSQQQGNYLKVVSAHTDLSGQKELAWAADDGHAVGAARCTQKFAFSNQSTPAVKPTLLVCWRTTADRSAYTVAVVRSGRPSEQRSATMLNEAWTKLS